MNKNATAPKKKSDQAAQGITRVTVCGFKSISREQTIEIRPLTILAGANSSGKSSIMQPVLLLKQTLEAPYDPGPLLLTGPNVKFSSADQMFSILGGSKRCCAFSLGIGIGRRADAAVYFRRNSVKGVQLDRMTYKDDRDRERIDLRMGMASQEIMLAMPETRTSIYGPKAKVEWAVARNRCFLQVTGTGREGLSATHSVSEAIAPFIRESIHVPGLRGNPERTYPMSAVSSMFPGTFEKYTASVIAAWQDRKEERLLEGLARDLRRLGLSWKVRAKRIDDTQVELQVPRLPQATKGGAHDLVNIADVGFGVSQSLPVLVALQAAIPGQLVYLEQPELHLHPRAQSALAEVLAEAAIRGIRVVAETHSALLLLGIQALVAEGKLSQELVKLHWFTRDQSGSTEVRSADLDPPGAFGEWPEDFAQVALEAESRYLDAAESRKAAK